METSSSSSSIFNITTTNTTINITKTTTNNTTIISNKDDNESNKEYCNRIFINACKYFNSNNNITTVVTIDAYDSLYNLCKANNINVKTLSELSLQQMNDSSIQSNNLQIDIDEFLSSYRKQDDDDNNTSNINTSSSSLYQFKPYMSNTDIRLGLASGALLKGTISINKYISHQAEVVTHHTQYPSNILIVGSSELNRAIDGDVVAVKIDATINDDRKVAKVVGILKRLIKEIIAIVPNSNTTGGDNILVVPLDKRIPKIRVKLRNWYLLQNHKIVVTIDDWAINSNYPHGHYVRLIGPCGDLKTEINSLLLKNSIFPRPFSPKAIACLPMTPIVNSSHVWVDSGWVMPETEIFNGTRLDMRTTRRVFSVDPEGCQDIDDAMSVEWIRPGVIEVAISIADVCAFVPHLSALDIEARNRGTTVYLVDQRIDMLPSLISSDIASLHGNKDRYAFTVKITAKVYHSNGTIVTEDKDPMKLDDTNDIFFELDDDVWVGRTAIRSVAAMTYEQGHNLIFNKNPNIYSNLPPGQAGGSIPGSLHQGLRKDLRLLTVFSRFLKKRRQVNGSFDLHSSAELKYQTDLEGNPIAIKQKEDLEIHDTIAELMIITNSKVAELICRSSSTETTGGLVRTHMPPKEDFEQLKSLFVLANLEPPQSFLEVNSVINKLISDNPANTNINVKSVVDYLTSILIKSMSEARYCCSITLDTVGDISNSTNESKTMGHFGLGLKYYTHFTSPIRRYADVVVHRQLLSIISSTSSSSSSITSVLPGYQFKAVAPDSSIKSVLDIVYPETNTETNTNDELLDGLLLDNIADNITTCNLDDDLLDTLLGSSTTNATDNISNNIDDLLDQLLENDVNDNSVKSNIDNQIESLLESAKNDIPGNAIKTANNICPYDSRELETIADHLNVMNRRAKQVQRDISKLYLSIYFSKNTEEHNAIIYEIKDDLLYVYLPVFDYKGIVHTETDDNNMMKDLIPMQRVKVSVSCESIDSLNLKLRLVSVNAKSEANSFKTDFNTIASTVSINNAANEAQNLSQNVDTNIANTSNNIFQICQKFGKNRNNVKVNSKVNKVKPKVVNRVEISGRIAFGDLTTTSLFFQKKEINSNTNEEALSVASSSIAKAGRDAAYEKMIAWGETWAEEEDLEDFSSQDQAPGDQEENLHRHFQRDTQLAMTRMQKLKIEKKKSRLYR